MKDQPIDGEYLSQTDRTIFDIAQEAVNFAVAVITQAATSYLAQDVEERALELLGRYGDIHRLDVPPLFAAKLLIRNYGEEEFEGMYEVDEVPQAVWDAYLESKKAQ
jgi:hypothetical protein